MAVCCLPLRRRKMNTQLNFQSRQTQRMQCGGRQFDWRRYPMQVLITCRALGRILSLLVFKRNWFHWLNRRRVLGSCGLLIAVVKKFFRWPKFKYLAAAKISRLKGPRRSIRPTTTAHLNWQSTGTPMGRLPTNPSRIRPRLKIRGGNWISVRPMKSTESSYGIALRCRRGWPVLRLNF